MKISDKIKTLFHKNNNTEQDKDIVNFEFKFH